MPPFFRQTIAIIRKDLRREARTREVLTTTVSFSVLLTVVFTFAFYRTGESVAFVFPGILWASVVFAGTLAIGRTFAQETENGCLRALSLVPSAHASVYVGKLIINLLFMFAFEAVVLPFLALAFDVPILDRLGWYVLALIGGTIGFTALGTLISAMLVQNHLRDVLLPIVLYPLIVPLLIAGVKTSALILGDGDAEAIVGWIQIMGAMDIIFLVASYLLFRWVLGAVE